MPKTIKKTKKNQDAPTQDAELLEQIDTEQAKKAQEAADTELLAMLDKQWIAAKANRDQHDWDWFINYLWYMGFHNAKYDRQTKQIVNISPNDKVFANLIFSVVRSVRNYATRHRPRAEVTPFNQSREQTDQFLNQNRQLSKVCDYTWDANYMAPKFKEVILDSLVTSVGFWQILWKSDAADGNGDIDVNTVDPFDLYIDPRATKLRDANYAILCIRRTKDDMKSSGLYDADKIDDLSIESRISENSVKTQLASIRGEDQSSSDEQTGSILLREHWYFKLNENNKKELWITTVADNKIIRNEKTDFSRLPFFCLSADIQPRSLYGFGWIKFLIPLQKELNRLLCSISDYNRVMNKGKVIVDRGANVNHMTNEHGEFIFKNPGTQVEQMNITPMGSAVFKSVDLLKILFEDIGSYNAATRGRVPTGITSGRGLEVLQTGDANNMSEFSENVEAFLRESFSFILELQSKKYIFARNVLAVGTSGSREFLQAIGASAPEELKKNRDDLVIIPEHNLVDVKIGSYLAETNEAKREILKELYSMQAIDLETLLKGYELSNVAEIIAGVKQEKQEAVQLEASKAGAIAQAETPPAPAEKTEGARAAIAAIKTIVQGQEPQMPTNPGQEYVDYLDKFITDPETGGSLPAQLRSQLEAFRNQVLQQVG